MRADCLLVALLGLGASLEADVLVRWDRGDIPPASILGITRVVVPAADRAAAAQAAASGYDVYVEAADGRQVTPFEPAAGARPASGRVVEERGKWPHIRPNWLTTREGVLQVAGRSAQPWIDNNAALLRIRRSAHPDVVPLLTYPWKPLTAADADAGPALENYLVAIAEAGSFGGDLVLPVHARFASDLLLGKPQARADWSDIRRYIEFYAWNLSGRYRPLANVGVITADTSRAFEALNLLARHNVPFDVVPPAELAARDLTPFELLIVLDTGSPSRDALARFEQGGGRVIAPGNVNDPNGFALETRQALGREGRIVDIWNGITVVAAPWREPEGDGMLVTLVNYAHQALPVQVRVRGTFGLVHFESPEQEPALLSYEHRDGGTEFVIPSLRIGGRVFLSKRMDAR